MSEQISQHTLDNFTGTENYIRFSRLFKNHLLTDGAHFVANKCKAYWLFDAIASYHARIMKNPRLQEMQIWILQKLDNSQVVLKCFEDTGEGEKPKITQKIEYSDFFETFTDNEIKFYVMPQPTEEGNTLWIIMLPSEY